MVGKVSKRRGPKPAGPFEDKRKTMSTRLTEKTRAALDRASRATGRSLSQEIELRLERSFSLEESLWAAVDIAFGPQLGALVMAMGETMSVAASTAATRRVLSDKVNGTSWDWITNPNDYAEVARAAIAFLEYMRPGDPTREVDPAEPMSPERLAASNVRAILKGEPDLVIPKPLQARLKDMARNAKGGIS